MFILDEIVILCIRMIESPSMILNVTCSTYDEDEKCIQNFSREI
jgi:hypothetical protein